MSKLKCYTFVIPGMIPSPGVVSRDGTRDEGVPEMAMVCAANQFLAEELLYSESEECESLNWDVEVYNEDCHHSSEPKVLFIQDAPLRPPLVSCNDLFKIREGRKSYGLSDYLHESFFKLDFYEIDDSKNTRILTRIIHDPYIDGDWSHVIGTIWFDDQPIGISQCAGDCGTDYKNIYITDKFLYNEAVKYLKTLIIPEPPEDDDNDIVDPDLKIRDLNIFYGGSYVQEKQEEEKQEG